MLSCIFLILLDRSHCLCLFICLNKLYFGIILDWTRLQQLHRISVYILPCSLTLTSFITTVHLSKLRNQHWHTTTNLFEFQQFSHLLSSFCPRSQCRLPHRIWLSCLYIFLWPVTVSQSFPMFTILKFMENASLLFNNPQFRFEKCFPYD